MDSAQPLHKLGQGHPHLLGQTHILEGDDTLATQPRNEITKFAVNQAQ